MIEDRKTDKTVVISGATKGLGRALSLEFARGGYRIIGLYRADAAAAEALAAEFRENGFAGDFIRQDITEDGEWPEFDEILGKSQARDFTFIANACSPFAPKPLHLTSWTEISAQLEVNVKGALGVFSRLLPLMAKARQGTFISVLSAAMNPPAKGYAAYLTAKSALDGLTKSIAAEYRARGIRVFSVSPGFMETNLTAGWSEHFRAAAFSRNGAPQNPARCAAEIFALSEDRETRGEGENYLLGDPAHYVNRTKSSV